MIFPASSNSRSRTRLSMSNLNAPKWKSVGKKALTAPYGCLTTPLMEPLTKGRTNTTSKTLSPSEMESTDRKSRSTWFPMSIRALILFSTFIWAMSRRKKLRTLIMALR